MKQSVASKIVLAAELPGALVACLHWLCGSAAMPAAAELEAAQGLLREHGLLPAIAAALPDSWPSSPLIQAARTARAALAARELAHALALRRIDAAFVHAGIDALVIKGEALAQTEYASTRAVRAREDIDLWVAPECYFAAADTLRALGFEPIPNAAGEWSLPQQSFIDPGGVVVDLHRRLNARPIALPQLDYAATRARSVAFGRARSLFMPDPADALLIAALHLYGHHADAIRALWLIDVDRILKVSPACLASAVERARTARIATLLVQLLRLARYACGTALEPEALDRLEVNARSEPSSRLVHPMRPLTRLWFDFTALPHWRAKIAWLEELLAPPASYLRQDPRYARRGSLLLVRLERTLAGIWKRSMRARPGR